MVVDHGGRHRGRPAVVENDGGLAPAMIASDHRMDLTAWQKNANRQEPDAPANFGGNGWSGEPSFVGQDLPPNDRK